VNIRFRVYATYAEKDGCPDHHLDVTAIKKKCKRVGQQKRGQDSDLREMTGRKSLHTQGQAVGCEGRGQDSEQKICANGRENRRMKKTNAWTDGTG
jgi:hypothetical protein